jgi:phage baseplate assembly protein gpV
MIIDGFERVGLGITTGIKGIGNITAVGNIDLEGSINATGDVVGSGISLRTHTHSGVQPGGGNTGQPNS